MKTKFFLMTILFVMSIPIAFSQEKSKKTLRNERKTEHQKQITEMVNSKEFVFVANRALPQGYQAVDMTTNPNSLNFHPEMIESYMPFFGRAYNVRFGNDNGLKFDGKPDEFSVKTIKKGYEVNVKVAGKNDFYDLFMTIGPDGNASLTITSNNRSTITYYGNVGAVEKTK